MVRKLWLVRFGNSVIVMTEFHREGVKRRAQQWIGGNPDDYTIEPLTNEGDRVRIEVTLSA